MNDECSKQLIRLKKIKLVRTQAMASNKKGLELIETFLVGVDGFEPPTLPHEMRNAMNH